MNLLSGITFLTALVTVSATFASNADSHHLIALMLDGDDPGSYAAPEAPTGAQICYGEFGCFSRFPPGVFPEPPWFIRPKFRLYIPTSDDAVNVYSYDSVIGDEDEETQKSLRDPTKKLIFVAHGFGETSGVSWLQDVKTAKTKTYGQNVITVDWSNGARPTTLYLGAAANSVLVGRIVSVLALQFVQKYGIPLANVEFIGFSLGAQVSGFFAKEMFEKTGQKIGRITALDCAAPSFENRGIYPSKAHVNFIEALHSASGRGLFQGRVGISVDYGHVDYYMNGGIHQPGCRAWDVSCSHKRAHDYYVDAITNRDKCLYRGFLCDSVSDANRGSCSTGLDPTHFIGQNNVTTQHAILFVKTESSSPFCKN